MRNQYSFSEFTKNVYSFLMTKIFFNKARLVRRPVYIRGRKSLVGGQKLTTGRFCRFDLIGSKKTLYIGNNCEFGDMTHIVAHENVKIGNNVLIASKCFISDTNHGEYYEGESAPDTTPNSRELITHPVTIGNNVWIGENVVILAGSSIGDGCIIGANSLVKGEIPKGSIAVGNPARVVKKWDWEARVWKKV